MNKRILSASIFLAVYLVFLAWYDGWGIAPLSMAEVEQMISGVGAQTADPEQLENFRQMARADDGEEFFMLNLNRYEYAEGEDTSGVPAAYESYGQAVIGMILRNAGHPIYSGDIPDYLLSGQRSDIWHEVILVRYRSRRDFLTMVTSDEFQRLAQVRSGGIDFADVTPTRANTNLTTPRSAVFILLLLIALIVDRMLRTSQ